MSLQEALRFFRETESDRSIGKAVSTLTPDATLEDLAAIAIGLGFDVTVEELRQAFAADTALRRRFYTSSSQE